MAEALVSVVIEQLVSILRQQAEGGIRLTVNAGEEVQSLKSNFLAIQAVVEDAESKQVKDKAVRDWLEKLRDVSYDIDDVLDEWNTAIQKLRIQEVENANSKSLRKVCSLFPCYGFCVRRRVVHYDIAVKIKNLNTRLDVIAIEKDRFNFRITKGIGGVLERPITTSDIDVSDVRGRDEEKDTLLNFLMSESSQGLPIPIISLVGMGGIGKTTLARLAYNDDKVNAHFDQKIWVCVSEPFDQIRIAKAILESLINNAPNLNELETVMQNIRQSIQGKTFLLVLDDVWTEDPKDWEPLKHSLMRGCPGSRILVTTRKENVANVIGTTHIILIGTLPENQCWSLFSQLAFSGRTREECEELKGTGEKLVQRCKGLPLAVKALGSLLRFKREIKEWQSVLDSEIWEVEELERGLFPPLLLSYYDLPSILKKCFAYCAIFPKDYSIDREELIKLWMAQDYLKAEPSQDEELIGEKYFKSLAMRSFFQDFEKDFVDGSKIIRCKMHDIVHDFAQFLTKNECFALVVDCSEKSLSQFNEKGRHLLINVKEQASFPISVYNVKNLRSLVVEDSINCRDDMNLSNRFDRLTCLKTLHFKESLIEQIPRGIENLIHLRYINLAGNRNIKQLPETFCELYNLQILDVRFCGSLQKLPQGIGKLINLRYLYCYGSSISYMPKGVERLPCLQRLHNFVVNESDDGRKACNLGCLKNFNHLKSLGIEGLENLADLDDAQLNNKRHLDTLFLNFKRTLNDDEVVVEAVQPPLTLEALTIENYRGKTVFPNWLMSLTKLRRLFLLHCLNCENLPPLGKLPYLEELIIKNSESIKRVGNEVLGIESDIATSSPSFSPSFIAFPKLKSLWLEGMQEWEEWEYGITETTGISEQHNHVTIMPCLRGLILYGCPKLKSVPSHILPMAKANILELHGCPLLEEYLDHEKNGKRDQIDHHHHLHQTLSIQDLKPLQLPAINSQSQSCTPDTL